MTLEAAPLPGEAYLPQQKTVLTKGGDLPDFGGKAIIGLATFGAYSRTGVFQFTPTSTLFYAVGLGMIALGLYLQREAQK